MATTAAESSTWEEIELAERYLLSCMFEEATSLASSIIKNLRENNCVENDGPDELGDKFEAAGMVLVQSMKELGRTPDILKELKLLFGSLTAMPAQVFLTGVCLQISEGPSGVQEYLEEFLNSWRYSDQEILFSTDATLAKQEGFGKESSIGVDEYLEIVELYVITYLGTVTREIDIAISWVENAQIPEQKRQELLRRLHSMNAPKTTSTSQVSDTYYAYADERKPQIRSSRDLESGLLTNGENSVKEKLIKLSAQRAPCFWWFRTFTLKFGNYRFVLSNGNVLLSCLFLFICYFYRRKQATLKRFVRKQALSIKKSLVDTWQLAFSYQVTL